MRFHSSRTRRRHGLAVMEIVMTTALTLPLVAIVFWLVVKTVRIFFGMLGTGVSWPYL